MKQVILMLHTECNIQKKLVNLYEKELKKLPSGSLSKKGRNNHYYYYYQYKTLTGKFAQRLLKEEESLLLEQLKRRHFLELALKKMHINIKQIEKCVNKFEAYDPDNIEKALPTAYHDLPLKCYTDTGNKNVKLWMNEKYEINNKYPEHKVHHTTRGELVRSKSEAIIAGLLASENIPYKYEAPLKLGTFNFNPDFTILKPRDNKIVYWEHFGLIDSPEYLKAAFEKLLLFREHDIKLGKDLLISFDSVDGGIDIRELQDMIQLKLL